MGDTKASSKSLKVIHPDSLEEAILKKGVGYRVVDRDVSPKELGGCNDCPHHEDSLRLVPVSGEVSEETPELIRVSCKRFPHMMYFAPTPERASGEPCPKLVARSKRLGDEAEKRRIEEALARESKWSSPRKAEAH